MSYITTNTNTNITNTTICGNYFTQHIPLHIPRRSPNNILPPLGINMHPRNFTTTLSF